LLDAEKIQYSYREYRDDRLDADEIREVLRMLGATAREVLRTKDRAFVELGLSGDEPGERLVELMAEHPTLLQRPIGVLDGRAVIGRPPENLVQLVRGAT